jgi:hypothetical protein
VELAWDLMTEANSCPSCSRLILLAAGVFGLKNAIQLALICDTALVVEDAAGADVFGAAVFDAELVPLLPQAATPAHSAHASRIPDSAR